MRLFVYKTSKLMKEDYIKYNDRTDCYSFTINLEMNESSRKKIVNVFGVVPSYSDDYYVSGRFFTHKSDKHLNNLDDALNYIKENKLKVKRQVYW